MFDEEDSGLGVAIGVVFAIIALVIALVIGVGVHQLRASAAASQPAVAASAELSADVLFVDVEEVGEPLVKIYFELGQSVLPAGAASEVDAVLAALQAQAGTRALVSGFHDESGSAAANAAIAAKRAVAVRDALVAAGIDVERILLRRPAVMLGGDDAAEARRVEIRVQ